MILLDLNQVMFSSVLSQDPKKRNIYDENLIRHIVLNTLRSFNREYSQKFGRMILCADSRDYWRKTVFPYYKAGRKKVRDASTIDWDVLFPMMNKIKDELQEHGPYQFIIAENAEADDVIGTLTPIIILSEDVLIISRDGDFVQLQKYNGKFKVKQLNPITKTFITSNNPVEDLRIKIIKGDSGDGIPNILSPSDTFVTGTRQKTITSKKLNEFLTIPKDRLEEIALIGYSRNEILIDFDFIPKEIKQKIIYNFNEPFKKNKQKLLSYFIQNKLTTLIECIEEF